MEVVFSDGAAAVCPFPSVTALPYVLSFGDISEPVPGEKRLAALTELYRASSGKQSCEIADSLMQSAHLSDLPGADALRVWYSDEPDELCGFAFLMERLTAQNFQGAVQAVKLPCPYIQPDGTAVFYGSWDQVEPELWKPLSHTARDISPVEQQGWANIWRGLRAQNAPLRAVLSGQLTGVPLHFYDTVIRQQIAGLDPEFDEAFLIGRTISRLPGVSDALIALRVQALVELGELEVLDADAAPDAAAYWRRLRRTARFSEI